MKIRENQKRSTFLISTAAGIVRAYTIKLGIPDSGDRPVRISAFVVVWTAVNKRHDEIIIKELRKYLDI